MEKQLKWIRNWCPMGTLPKENKIVALTSYTKLMFPSAYQPFLLMVTLFGILIIIFGTLGAVSVWMPNPGEMVTEYNWTKTFWSGAAIFATIMLYAIFTKNRRLAFLSASIALIFAAIQHLSFGLIYLFGKSGIPDPYLPLYAYGQSNIVNYFTSIIASIPLFLASLSLAKNQTLSRKLYSLIIFYGLVQIPPNVMISIATISVWDWFISAIGAPTYLLGLLSYLLSVLACVFVV